MTNCNWHNIGRLIVNNNKLKKYYYEKDVD